MKIDINRVNSISDRLLIRGANARKIQPLLQKLQNNEDLFQTVLLGTIIGRNVYKTGVYITTSLTAKQVPEEQRKLSAYLSLTHGMFSLLAMVPIGYFINKRSGRWAEKLFRSIKNDFRVYELAKLGFRSLLTVVVTGVLAQKFLVQYFATSTAKLLKDHIYKRPYENDLASKTRVLPQVDNQSISNNSFIKFSQSLKKTKNEFS